MNKKLQVFVSSTYKDLINERQKAVEGILKSRHIPAGMELFVPTDKTQWDIIQEWIKDSDVLLLILGGRYGSVEYSSKKSYTHLEYEFALKHNIPVFTVILNDQFLANKKSENIAIEVYEHEVANPAIEQYKEFKKQVMSNYAEFVENTDQISGAVTLALKTFIEKDSIYYHFRGWIRGSERTGINKYNWETIIEKYLDEKKRKGRKKNTLDGYASEINILHKFFGEKNVQEINGEDMRNFFIYREDNFQVKERSSLEKIRGVINVFFEWMIQANIIKENPVNEISSYQFHRKEMDTLTNSEISLMRKVKSTPRDKALFEILLSTGCHLSEVGRIKREDIDWENKTISITNSKGEKRISFLTEKAGKCIQEYLKVRKDNLNLLIVTERRPCRDITAAGIQAIIRKIAEKANINRSISPRTFRYTFANILEELDYSVNVIETLLGYSPRKNRSETYTKITQKNIWEIIKERPDF